VKTEQVRQVEETLKRSTDLNQRQLALLAHALRHPNAEYTIRSHMTSHSVAYATARADLFRLADLGLLERRRVGRRSYLFFPPTDLDDRVRSVPPQHPDGGLKA
jgi:Fic family protein